LSILLSRRIRLSTPVHALLGSDRVLANDNRWPNLSLLPIPLLDKAAHHVFQQKPVAYPAMCYGPDAGDPRLRKNMAQWLTNFYRPADPVSEERICITGGASQNLACLLQDFTDPLYTRNVWIVAPAYMLAFRIFEDAGFHKKLRAVPEDGQGIDMDYLRSQIRTSEDEAKTANNNEPVSGAFDVSKMPTMLLLVASRSQSDAIGLLLIAGLLSSAVD